MVYQRSVAWQGKGSLLGESELPEMACRPSIGHFMNWNYWPLVLWASLLTSGNVRLFYFFSFSYYLFHLMSYFCLFLEGLGLCVNNYSANCDTSVQNRGREQGRTCLFNVLSYKSVFFMFSAPVRPHFPTLPPHTMHGLYFSPLGGRERKKRQEINCGCQNKCDAQKVGGNI